jgi:hypothetical protein
VICVHIVKVMIVEFRRLQWAQHELRYKGDQGGIRNFGEETCWEIQTVRPITCKDNVKMDRGEKTEWKLSGETGSGSCPLARFWY